MYSFTRLNFKKVPFTVCPLVIWDFLWNLQQLWPHAVPDISRLNKELKKRIITTMTWSVTLYGSETWTLRETDVKLLKALKIWTWRQMADITWKDKMRNDELWRKLKSSAWSTWYQTKIEHRYWTHSSKKAVEGRVAGKTSQGRQQKGTLNDIIDEERSKKIR